MKITLCGSTRFKSKFEEMQLKLGMAGHIVYSLNGFGREASDVGKPDDFPLFTDHDKVKLDLVHLAKIEESDAVLILNVGGYVGESTKRELMWAELRNKEIFFLEKPRLGGFITMPDATYKLFNAHSPWFGAE